MRNESKIVKTYKELYRRTSIKYPTCRELYIAQLLVKDIEPYSSEGVFKTALRKSKLKRTKIHGVYRFYIPLYS